MRLFAATAVLMVVEEALEIHLGQLMPPAEAAKSILAEVDVLMVIGLPFLYVAAFRPLFRVLAERRQADEALRQSERELAARSAVSELAVREMDSGRLLTRVIDHVVTVLGASGGWVLRPGDQSGLPPRIEGARGIPLSLLGDLSAELFLDSPTCCGGLLDRIPPGETTLIRECRHLPREVLAAAGFGTYIGVTLPTGHAVRAVLNLVWRDARDLSDSDRQLLVAIARSVGIAAESAAMRDAEVRARQVADTISSVSLRLNETLDRDAVLRTLLEGIGRFVPYDRGKVMLLEGESWVSVRAVFGPDGADDSGGDKPASIEAFKNPLVSQVLQTCGSVYVADMHLHPAITREMQSPHERSWLGVPIQVAGRAIGLVVLVKSGPDSFSYEQVRLAEALCAPASVAIANATLFGEVKVGKRRLEELSRKLVDVQELERRHLARELHDEIGQALTAILYRLEALRTLPPASGDDVLAETIAIADRTIHSVRDLSLDLRPPLLDEAGLGETLRWYVGRQVRSDSLDVTVDVSPVLEELPPDLRIVCFRIVQEALTNVVRHSGARHVEVQLGSLGATVEIEIRDDGRGFDVKEALGHARTGRGLGIRGMKERAELCGGELVFESREAAGTRVRATIPILRSPVEGVRS